MHKIPGFLLGCILSLAGYPHAAAAQAPLEAAYGVFEGRDKSGTFGYRSAAKYDLDQGIISMSGPELSWYIQQIAEAPQIGVRFASDGHNVGTLDPKSGEFKVIPYDKSLPSISWLGGIAWDSLRKRLIAASAWHNNRRLYAYYPKTGKWTVVANLPHHYFRGWVYLRDQDVLAAITPAVDAAGDVSSDYKHLVKFNAKGRAIKYTPIYFPFYQVWGSTFTQPMLTTEGRLLVSEQGSQLPYPYAIHHLIDLSSGWATPVSFLTYTLR
jgi:hypothetical protein